MNKQIEKIDKAIDALERSLPYLEDTSLAQSALADLYYQKMGILSHLKKEGKLGYALNRTIKIHQDNLTTYEGYTEDNGCEFHFSVMGRFIVRMPNFNDDCIKYDKVLKDYFGDNNA